MSAGVYVAMTVVTAAAVALVVVVVVRTSRREARVNVMLDRAHEQRVARWAMSARSGRGDPPPRRAPLALPSGLPRSSGSSGSAGSSGSGVPS